MRGPAAEENDALNMNHVPLMRRAEQSGSGHTGQVVALRAESMQMQGYVSTSAVRRISAAPKTRMLKPKPNVMVLEVGRLRDS